MGVGRELQLLGRYLDDCERSSDAVDSIDVAEVTGVGENRLTANLQLTVSVPTSADGVSLCNPQVGPDGTVRFALETTTELANTTGHDVTVEPTDAALDEDGTVTVMLAAAVPARAAESTDTDDSLPDRTGSTDVTPTSTRPSDDDSSTGRSGRSVPPFKDPDLLEQIYESCDTFAEMAETLEMDVTGETVRRYMIEHDIHHPTTYQTQSTEAASESAPATQPQADAQDDGDTQPVVLSDGIGLPADVTVETLIETVKRSNTIYEVKRDIDVDREDALEMLKELNLLDLVVGQLATESERNITRADVVKRLRDASAVN